MRKIKIMIECVDDGVDRIVSSGMECILFVQHIIGHTLLIYITSPHLHPHPESDIFIAMQEFYVYYSACVCMYKFYNWNVD